MQNLLQELETLLATQTRFVQEGKMIKQAIIDAAQALDADFLQLLLQNENLKKHFFQQVGDIMVFDKVKLLRFVSNKAFLADSYTEFKNKIGLAPKNLDGLYDAHLSNNKEVVLVYPYKDCMLEGGQTKEEQGRNELFWNETLAPDDIDRLKQPKAFTNLKRYTSEGVTTNIDSLSLKDNFIIKGNNLLALYSLLPIYRNKVKLIYIDPPYNTGNDSFRYNDSFNHSTWLTFMKDRLKVARELLREDGVIFIQCDDNEQAYLKVLTDEIFGRNNFVVNNVYKRRKTQANLTKYIAPIHENILCFAKNILNLVIYNLPLKEEYVKKMYKNPDNDVRGVWRLAPLLRPDNSQNKIQEFTMPNGRKIKGKWSCSESTFNQYIKDNVLVVTDNGSPNKKIFLKDSEGLIPNTWLDDIATTEEASKEIELLFGTNNAFSYSKPEGIIKYILNIVTKEEDIILDFFVGSGTTAAVAHKMGRHYIGIEQMDYIEEVTVKRLEKVIKGEQGGISKSINWQGGGSFIYLELAKANQHYVERIQAAETTEVLGAIWKEMQEKAFMSYKISVESIDKEIKAFEALSFVDKQRFLISVLDKNMLYVPHCDMYTEEFGMSEADIKSTEMFYGME